jgi:hypothetical protein
MIVLVKRNGRRSAAMLAGTHGMGVEIPWLKA